MKKEEESCLFPALLVRATFYQLVTVTNKEKVKEKNRSGKIKSTFVDYLQLAIIGIIGSHFYIYVYI